MTLGSSKYQISQLWASDEKVFLGEIAPGGNFICCLLIVGIFMGLRGTYSLGEDFKDFKDKDFFWEEGEGEGQATKRWDYFL